MAKITSFINEETFMKALDRIPHVSVSVEEMANDYLKRHKDVNKAAKSMLNQLPDGTTEDSDYRWF